MASIRLRAFQPDFHSCRYCVGERGQIASGGRKKALNLVSTRTSSPYARFIIALGLWATKAAASCSYYIADVLDVGGGPEHA